VECLEREREGYEQDSGKCGRRITGCGYPGRERGRCIGGNRCSPAAWAKEVEFAQMNSLGQTLPTEVLASVSANLQGLLSAADLCGIGQVRAPAALAGQVLARAVGMDGGTPGRDVFGREIPAPVETPAGRFEIGPYAVMGSPP
jgi:hypothetical protein